MVFGSALKWALLASLSGLDNLCSATADLAQRNFNLQPVVATEAVAPQLTRSHETPLSNVALVPVFTENQELKQAPTASPRKALRRRALSTMVPLSHRTVFILIISTAILFSMVRCASQIFSRSKESTGRRLANNELPNRRPLPPTPRTNRPEEPLVWIPITQWTLYQSWFKSMHPCHSSDDDQIYGDYVDMSQGRLAPGERPGTSQTIPVNLQGNRRPRYESEPVWSYQSNTVSYGIQSQSWPPSWGFNSVLPEFVANSWSPPSQLQEKNCNEEQSRTTVEPHNEHRGFLTTVHGQTRKAFRRIRKVGKPSPKKSP